MQFSNCIYVYSHLQRLFYFKTLCLYPLHTLIFIFPQLLGTAILFLLYELDFSRCPYSSNYTVNVSSLLPSVSRIEPWVFFALNYIHSSFYFEIGFC